MVKRIYILCIIFNLFFSSFVFSQQNDTIIHGPFNISWCNDGQFYFEENTDLEYPINFILECGGDKKIIDQYYVDGANDFINFAATGSVIPANTNGMVFVEAAIA